jgi:hypothetical protein
VLVNAVNWHVTTQSAFLPGIHLPLSPRAVRADYQLTPHHLAIDRIRAMVPWDAPISVQTNLACFFADRRALYPFPSRALDADYVLIDLTETYGHRTGFRKFWLEWERQCTVSKYCQSVRELLGSSDHRVMLFEDGYVLFARRAAGLGASGRRDLPSTIDVQMALSDRCREWEALTGRGYGR